jgi:SAM-dependent methyltransferase
MVISYYELKYELKFRSNTAHWIYAEDLDFGDQIKEHSGPYGPSAYYSLHKAFNAISDDFTNQSLVDFGCGLGRALMFASLYPFREVIGVEASENLCKGAKRNIQAFCDRTKPTSFNWKIVHGDARKFSIPSDAAVFYFYDPFDETIMEPVIKNIISSIKQHPRTLYAIYLAPTQRDLFYKYGFSDAFEFSKVGETCLVLKYDVTL